MKMPSILMGGAGLGLLALAGWLATFPRPNPKPDLPEIPPIHPGERIALLLERADIFPAAESLGLLQRTRGSGAEVRVLATLDEMADFQPHRIFRPAPWPESPSGYHPDQWPVVAPAAAPAGAHWQILVLDSDEIAAKNAAVAEAARVIRESGTDDARGTRELQVLSRARRAEIYAAGPISAENPALE